MCLLLLVQQPFFVFVKIIFPLLEIIKAVIGSRRLFLRFFVLAALLVFGVKRADVLQACYLFLLPAFQYLISILKAGLSAGLFCCMLPG